MRTHRIHRMYSTDLLICFTLGLTIDNAANAMTSRYNSFNCILCAHCTMLLIHNVDIFVVHLACG